MCGLAQCSALKGEPRGRGGFLSSLPWKDSLTAVWAVLFGHEVVRFSNACKCKEVAGRILVTKLREKKILMCGKASNIKRVLLVIPQLHCFHHKH